MSRLYVIGIGYKPLDKRARNIILNSSVILASNRLLEIFKGYEEYETGKDKIKVINNVDETINFIKSQISSLVTEPALSLSKGHSSLNIVLLASGDPMFFGIGRRVVKEFGKDAVEILPDLSSIQVAFSKIKEPWDDALLISLHGGPDPEKRRRLEYEIKDIPMLLEGHNKIAILTDKVNNPSEIAKEILKSPSLHHSITLSLKMYVCERLGYPDEKITEGTPEEIAGMPFSDPNVVIIQNIIPPTHPSPSRGEGKSLPRTRYGGGGESLASGIRFGLTENEILHSRGLITKDEVRAVTIHKLRLPQRGVFWDIGAGSGSISIEAARISPQLKIFSVEKDEEQIKMLKENIKSLIPKLRDNIDVIEGEAAAVIPGLPGPDRVFIGGSGGKLHSIIKATLEAGCSRIVINAVTFDTLTKAQSFLKKENMKVEITEVNISKGKGLKDKEYLSASNPIFIIVGEKANG
ncbi:MAG: precorrin-6y C5,15-methyltransferase (decarboxylating) subunit CbiE [Nitrospirae bacterium]|nr:precorrin-6y C5,15-methyltransferase (decarboxylating) subunit CbiE [Nitrospirota bacterium]